MPCTILKHISATAVAETKRIKAKQLNKFSMLLQSLQKGLFFSFGQTGNNSPKSSLFIIACSAIYEKQ